MIDAKMLATLPSADDVFYEVWGVWIPRRGDNAVFAMEVVANFGAILTAELFEKNYDETGDGATTGLTMEFDQRPDRLTITKLGAKELVRFRLKVEKGRNAGAGEVGMALYRFLEPVWFESVKG
jgi:hypothetical protein